MYKINENCSNCMICIRACPVDAITNKDNKTQISEDLCIDCGLCMKVCPVNLISYEEKTTKTKVSKKEE